MNAEEWVVCVLLAVDGKDELWGSNVTWEMTRGPALRRYDMTGATYCRQERSRGKKHEAIR